MEDFTYEKIVFADDLPICESCGEPWCPIHNMHYADCPCIGPNEVTDDQIEEIDGVLYAKIAKDSTLRKD